MTSNKKEALYYEKLSEDKLKCLLCPNHCIITEGSFGFCRVRQAKNGKLYALNYGIISALANDPIEKKPLYEYYPGSWILSLGSYGCNLHCQHCQNSDISQSSVPNKAQKFSVADLVFLVRERNIEQVAFTYNEPLVWYEYVLEASQALQKLGVRVVMVSNGYIEKEPLAKLLPFTNAWSLDIKWFSSVVSQKLSLVKYPEAVRHTAKAIVTAGKHLEIVTNLVSGYNDSDEELEAITSFIAKELGVNIPWHVSRAFPRYKLQDIEPTPIEVLEKARKIGYKNGLKKIYLGNV